MDVFRQKDIRTKFSFYIRLAMPLVYIGGKKTGFYLSRNARNARKLFYYPIAEGDEGEACDEAEEDVGDESADIAVLEHL